MVEKRTIVNLIEAFAVASKHYLRGEGGIYYEDVSCLGAEGISRAACRSKLSSGRLLIRPSLSQLYHLVKNLPKVSRVPTPRASRHTPTAPLY